MSQHHDTPPIAVVAAVIERPAGVLLCQRPDGDHLPLTWEFPGGKIEPGEHPREAVIRELSEELGVLAQVGRELAAVHHDYGHKQVWIRFYAACFEGTPQARVHRQLRWVPRADLRGYETPPPNALVIERLLHGELDFH